MQNADVWCERSSYSGLNVQLELTARPAHEMLRCIMFTSYYIHFAMMDFKHAPVNHFVQLWRKKPASDPGLGRNTE